MGKQKRQGKSGSSTLVLILIFAAIICGAVAYVYVERPELFKKAEKPIVKPPEVAPVVPELVPEVKPPIKHILKDRRYPVVAIVIDDMGQDMGKLRDLLAVNEPLTIAVLPKLAHSTETANEAFAKGREVLLHLPMEPHGAGNNPGKGALLSGMSMDELRLTVDDDLKSVPHAIGINNHMGSLLTEEEAPMTEVLKLVKSKKMFFLDSRTSVNSVAGSLARKSGVRSADRNVFLDNTRDEAYITGQIDELIAIAKKRGRAVAIGHPYPETINAIRGSVEKFKKAGVRVVKLSEIIE